AGESASSYKHPGWGQPIGAGDYVHGLVEDVGLQFAKIKIGSRTASLGPAEFAWTKRKVAKSMLIAGDIVYVKVLALNNDGTARISLEQDSGVQGALLAIDNATGDVKAMLHRPS